MNIKLHTPGSLKKGSGMGSLKQFLLSLFATTVSIALTFGTAAIIDYNKKQKEKREIVIMVMYDMHNSLQSIEKADSLIRESMKLQRTVAEDTTKYNTQKYALVYMIPSASYTETTERIFSSNIETINTVGNVIFTENVAEFYQMRKYYKASVCDSLAHEIRKYDVFFSIKEFLSPDYYSYGLASQELLSDMQHLFTQCKQMMEVTDEEIDAYRKQRQKMDKDMGDDRDSLKSKRNDLEQLNKSLLDAVKKLNIK